jgi:hypothetical protein
MIKKNFIFAGFLILILSLSVVSFPLLADAENSNGKGKPKVVSGIGKVPGKDLYVDVLVLVPEGSDPQDVVAKALAKQGARPIGVQPYQFTGLVWDQFGDNSLSNDFVTQNYNPANEPANVNGRTVLGNTHSTWNNVETSSFAFSLNPTDTNRCPSLVLECTPLLPQNFDGNNDVGWVELESSSTLGVAWYGTSTDEVDIALDIGHPWFTDGTVYFDVETVLLHENGHGLGLAHSNVLGSIMNPSYDTIQRTLGTDDINGISALYPTPADPAITITSPTTTTVNGKITISASVVGVADPTVYFRITGPNGYEHISDDDSNEPFAISIHTKNWDSGSYLIEAFETSESQYDNKTVEKEGKTTDGSGGGGGGGSWDCTAKYHPKKCP